MEVKAAWLQVCVRSDGVGPLQQRLTFPDRHDLVVSGVRQQGAKSPDATEIERVVPKCPLRAKVLQRSDDLDPLPVVGDVQQITAVRTGDQHLFETIS